MLCTQLPPQFPNQSKTPGRILDSKQLYMYSMIYNVTHAYVTFDKGAFTYIHTNCLSVHEAFVCCIRHSQQDKECLSGSCCNKLLQLKLVFVSVNDARAFNHAGPIQFLNPEVKLENLISTGSGNLKSFSRKKQKKVITDSYIQQRKCQVRS